MTRLISMVTLLGLTLSLATGQALANVEYKFSGVTFSDGGTLTGTFTTNNAITSLLNFDITTSAGTDIGSHYTPFTFDSSSTSLPYILVMHESSLDKTLQVTFDGSLSATGAPIKIGTFDSFEQTPLSRRDIVAGQAVLVPEPEAYAMLMAGLGLIGLIARRRKQIS